MRILICDDEGIVQQAIRFMIQKSFGDEFEIESAKNGRMAIELAESFRPDIILMDIQMPGINGIEAMEEIKISFSLFLRPMINLNIHRRLLISALCLI